MHLSRTRTFLSLIALLAVAPGYAGGPAGGVTDQAAQTAALRKRIESLRDLQTARVSLSFTGLTAAYAAYHPESQLRFHDCGFDVATDVSGLVDILLGAKLAVGYPVGWDNNYLPEGRFEVIFGADQPDELLLWFSNPGACAG